MKTWTNLFVALALCLGTPALAQDDSNAQILHSVDEFLRGLNQRDPAVIAAVSTEQGLLVSHRLREGKEAIRFRTFAEDLANIGQGGGTFRETYWDPTVLVRGNIAVVWAEYSFDFDGKRTHCGIDVFNLIKIDGAWKVTGIQYTVEPDNCPKGR
jgi:ketosteroid isomerase-like protein